jgi:hypothetical protein
LLIVCLASCASISTSDTYPYALDDSEVRISARAERGVSEDHLFIVINNIDVAEGPFGSAQAAGRHVVAIVGGPVFISGTDA